MKRLLGLLGWLGVVLVLAAVALRIIQPERAQLYQGLAMAGLVVTALYALSQWREIGRSFQGKDVRYGSMAAGSVVLFLAILVGLNWIASRQNKRWDLTETQQFSLSDQTTQILSQLPRPMTIRVFHGAAGSQEYRDRLDAYTYQSSQVSVEYIDAEQNPDDAVRDNITMVPTAVIEYDGRTERTSQIDEQGLTNAIKKVVEGKAKKAYFVQGHGEVDPAATDPTGYKGIADAMANDNLEVAKLTLAQESTVPEDATIVVVAGPKIDFFPPEIEALRAFLTRGGKLFLLLDPPDKDQSAQPQSLIALAKEWGIEVGNDLVVDASGIGQIFGANEVVPIGMPLPHAVNNNFRTAAAFPIARSAAPIDGGTDGRVAQKLIETSPQSWAEGDVQAAWASGSVERNLDKGDTAGPIALAAAVSAAAPEAPAPAEADAPAPETRLIVVGDSNFASNRYVELAGNRDLFLNMSNWLAQQEDLIAIRPRDPGDRRISMTQDQAQMVLWLALAIIPGLLLANGIRVWWKKR